MAPELTSTGVGTAQREPGLSALGCVVILGTIVAAIDGTVMVVAIDAMGKDFSASARAIQWVTGAYLLATCAAIPVSGYLVDRFGARTVWLLSLVSFLASVVLCGIAWSPASLILFRVIQGFSGGLIGMVATVVLTRAAGPERAGRAFGAVAVPSMLAPVLGPVAAGAVIDMASWRWLFFGQLPLLVIALVAALAVLPRDTVDRAARLDVKGLLLVTPGLAALVYGLAEIAAVDPGGSTETFGVVTDAGFAVVGILLTAAFARHALRRRADTLIDLTLFANRGFSVAIVLLFVVGFLLYGLLFLIPLYYQQVVGLRATAAGTLLAPQGAGMGIAAIFVGSLTDRFGARPIVWCGLVLTTVGTVPFALSGAEPDDLLLGTALALRGMGLASISIPLSASLYKSDLPQEAIPHITTVSAVAQRVGGAMGGAMAAVSLQLMSEPGREFDGPAFTTTFWWMTGLLLVPLALVPLLPRRAGPEA
ncbi:DHA2 family efflux MFS transporter permease subunit [Streptomyces sp. CA-210063]|uniref:DHA2 family efflux MFS transporter permease subunit n=1 Tax=Streptomyces sp. CA-210063 TaxID=2801029 RepID=UPI00214B603C|nr:DHA2 family efflux MFS transporter permease subunit [Streptomyces sp. CA-210063]UUU30251.1 DHA2 family efflux MFS transporter permease subunit [Streptomyces sp. CA-210063]